jgi:hypothetical protein
MTLLSQLAISAIRKSPSVPLCQRGTLNNLEDFSSLKKHALSAVEGRGRGRLEQE